MKISRKITRIQNSLIKIVYKFWENLWLILILFLILDLIISGFLFFRYYLNKEKIKAYSPIRINETLLNDFASQYENREFFFKKIETKIYSDPFKSLRD